MVSKKGKRSLITALSILVVLLVAIGTITLIRVLNTSNDPYLQQTSNQESTTNTQENASDETKRSTDSQGSATNNDGSQSNSALDPSTVSTIDIAPMEITVSYVKGAGAFEYEVLRANNGTRYVEFRSTELIGTKCTNDMGTFVSIVANPNENDSSTVTKTTTIDGVKYGLSLADQTCTSNAEKLATYQKSFSDAFSLLKKIQ